MRCSSQTLATIFALFVSAWASSTTCCPNDCSNHGTCDSSTCICNCMTGWGASSDIAFYKAPDCSARTCPYAKSWVDLPTASITAHAVAECSDMGLCNRDLGKCMCFPGFEGDACQRNTCHNGCSGNGQCVSLKQAGTMSAAMPISANVAYGGSPDTVTWDEDMLHGCVCDSSWTVGLASGETQEAEYFGPDCSRRHCPSGDDPLTTAVETNCEGINGGAAGNLCQVDCSRRGVCNHRTGECQCFYGFYGINCGTKATHITQHGSQIWYS